MPKSQINELLSLWEASMARAHPREENDAEHLNAAGFGDADHLLATIDAIRVGDAPWQSFVCRPSEAAKDGDPDWMKQEYEVWFRDVDLVIRNLLANPDFANEFDTIPYHEYNQDMQRRYCDFFSGDWVWKQAVSDIDSRKRNPHS